MSIETKLPGTATDGGGWNDINNIKIDDSSYAEWADYGGATDPGASSYLTSVIINSDSAHELNPYIALSESTLGVISVGGETDLLGLTLTPAIINSSSFDIVLTFLTDYGWTSPTMGASNFGFTIPTGATIDGIQIDIDGFYDHINFMGDSIYTYINYVKVTIYYTSGGVTANTTNFFHFI